MRGERRGGVVRKRGRARETERGPRCEVSRGGRTTTTNERIRQRPAAAAAGWSPKRDCDTVRLSLHTQYFRSKPTSIIYKGQKQRQSVSFCKARRAKHQKEAPPSPDVSPRRSLSLPINTSPHPARASHYLCLRLLIPPPPPLLLLSCLDRRRLPSAVRRPPSAAVSRVFRPRCSLETKQKNPPTRLPRASLNCCVPGSHFSFSSWGKPMVKQVARMPIPAPERFSPRGRGKMSAHNSSLSKNRFPLLRRRSRAPLSSFFLIQPTRRGSSIPASLNLRGLRPLFRRRGRKRGHNERAERKTTHAPGRAPASCLFTSPPRCVVVLLGATNKQQHHTMFFYFTSS
jgi:hypothetical protein